MKSSHLGRLQTPILNYGSLQVTDYGLVIYGLADAGFWVIPWSDVDTYRALAGVRPDIGNFGDGTGKSRQITANMPRILPRASSLPTKIE